MSDKLADLPCISRPTRKMRPAAHTNSTIVAVDSVMPAACCHNGGPGGIVVSGSMRNGVAVGKSETAIANLPVGARRIVDHVDIGSMTSIIAGIIIVCPSLISFQAAPIEMKIDPHHS